MSIVLPTGNILRADVGQVVSGWPGDSVDLAVIDPAYGLNKAAWDSVPDYHAALLLEVRRILKPSGTAYIFGPPETIAQNWSAFPSPKRLLTWAVSNRVTPSAKTWQATTESIVMLTKGKTPFFDHDAVREPYGADFERHRGRTRPPTPGRFGDKASTYSDAAGALPRDVLRGPGLSGRVGAKESLGHPCQKPLWLMERLIAASCPVSGIVADLYAGVATASVAAHRLGRQWIAVENDAHWCDVARDRLLAAGATATILEPLGPQALADLIAWKVRAEQELTHLREAVAALTARATGSI